MNIALCLHIRSGESVATYSAAQPRKYDVMSSARQSGSCYLANSIVSRNFSA